MAAYVIVDIEVTDDPGMAEYRKLVPATVEKYGGRFIARGGTIEVLEGDWHPNRLVLVEFPSVAAAREWWNSPEYSEAKRIRQETSEGTLLILEGV